MNVMVGLAIGIFVAVVICGVAAFAGICIGIVKEQEAKKKEKESKEEEEDEQ